MWRGASSGSPYNPANVAITGGSISGLSSLGLGDGTAASFSITSNLSGATDPTFVFGNALTSITNANFLVNSTSGGYYSGTSPGDVSMFRGGANNWVFAGAGAGAGAIASRTEL